MTDAPVLDVTDLRKHFALSAGLLGGGREVVRAVDGVSLSVRRGEVLGLVGESGSGKTTVGRAVLRLTPATDGVIRFEGQDITHLGRRALRPIRRRMQLIFQDPVSSLNPRMTVGEILATPLKIHDKALTRRQRQDRVAEALSLVGLSARYAARYPHEFSGGQRQRIGIARALILHPAFVVADEPVSALDVSVQAQIVNLLLGLQQSLQLAMLFIAHDLAVVGAIADRIAVMYLGRVVEVADTETLLLRPRHPYTQALLSAVPVPDPTLRRSRILLQGDPPSPLAPPSGCAFRTRCPHALPECAARVPALVEVTPGHAKACLRDDIAPVAETGAPVSAEIGR